MAENKVKPVFKIAPLNLEKVENCTIKFELQKDSIVTHHGSGATIE